MKSFVIIILLCIASLFVKLYVLNNSYLLMVEGDEAIVGIMGKHISEGHSFPVFVYGQDYMGSLEAFTSALMFRLFGINRISLKLAPLLYSILIIITFYFLGRLCFGEFTGIVAAVFIAFPPFLVIKWCLSPTGGHIENLLLCSLLLILSILTVKKNRYIIASGLAAGFAFWTNPFSIFCIVAVIIYFIHKKIFNIKFILIFAAGIFIGLIPFIIYNMKNKGISILKLGGFFLGVSGRTYSVSDNIAGLIFKKSMAMLTGLPSSFLNLYKIMVDSFYNYQIVSLIAVLVLVVFIIICVLKFYRRSEKKGELLLYILLFIFITLILSLSKRGTRPRYLLLYFIIIPFAAGYFIDIIFKKKKTAAFILLFLVIITNMVDIKINIKDKGFRKNIEIRERVLDFLRKNDIKYAYSGHYIASPLTFLTKEEIIISPAAGFYNEDRIPGYTEKVRQSKSPAFIFKLRSVHSSAARLQSSLDKLNIKYKKQIIDDYVIFFNLSKNVDLDVLNLPLRFKRGRCLTY